MPEALCVGNMVADVVAGPVEALPGRGRLALAERMELHAGGCGLNTAIGLAKLGVQTALIGRVGADGLGDFLRGEAENAGVDIQGVIRDAQQGTSGAMVFAHSDGERSFLHSIGANAALSPADVAPTLLRQSKILLVAGAGALPALDGESMAELFRRARQAGVVTALDMLWDAQGLWMANIGPCLPYVDYFLPSYEEAKMLAPGRDTPEAVGQTLLDAGARFVGLKMGSAGALLLGQDGTRLHAPALRVPVRSALGAGNAWVAGFLAGLARDFDLPACLALACAAGAACVMALGATEGIGSLEDTLRLAERYGAVAVD